MDTTSNFTPAESKENSQVKPSELLKNEGEVLEGGMMAKGIGGVENLQISRWWLIKWWCMDIVIFAIIPPFALIGLLYLLTPVLPLLYRR